MAAACYTARPTGGFEADGCAHVGGYRGGGRLRACGAPQEELRRTKRLGAVCGLGHSRCVGLTESDCRRGGGSSRYFVGGPSFDRTGLSACKLQGRGRVRRVGAGAQGARDDLTRLSTEICVMSHDSYVKENDTSDQ